MVTSAACKRTIDVCRLLFLFLIGLWFAPLSGSAAPGDWGQFRGPDGLGHSRDSTRPPVRLDRNSTLLWRYECDSGHSSPVIWGNRLIATQYSEPHLETICINRNTGERIWTTRVRIEQPERLHQLNSVASSTPVTNGEHVVVYCGSFGLICYDIDGNELWSRPIADGRNTFGTAASPVLVDDVLVFCCDRREDSFVEAIDVSSGETHWRTPRESFGSGWSTPMVWTHENKREIVIYGVWELKAYALEDGSARWTVPGLTDEPCITPIHHDGVIYITSYNMKTNHEVIGLPDYSTLLDRYDQNGDRLLSSEEARENKSVLSRFDADGEGDHPLSIFFRFLDEDRDGQIAADEWPKLVDWVDGFKHANGLLAIRPDPLAPTGADVIWKHERGVPEIPSPLVVGDMIYTVKNGGVLSCLDAATGSLHFQTRLKAGGPYYASPIASQDKIYVASARGVITIIQAAKQLQVLYECDLGERIMATPAIVDDTFYVRTERAIYAFGNGDEPTERLQDEPEVISLLGTKLQRPVMDDEVRVRLEANLREAKADYDRDPTNVDHAIWLGRRLAYLWRYQDAIGVYSRALERHPREARLLRHRGHRYITIRRFDLALDDLTRAAQLIEGSEDQIEPDGAPNEAGIPTSTLHTNVWYHLGLCHFLRGEYKEALAAYERCLAASTNNDMKVATLDWMYMTLRRLERDDQAKTAIAEITKETELIENFSYHRRILMYKGEISPESLIENDDGEWSDLELATQGFGVANFYREEGRTDEADRLLQQIVKGSYWAAFGYIAAEVDLHNKDN